MQLKNQKSLDRGTRDMSAKAKKNHGVTVEALCVPNRSRSSSMNQEIRADALRRSFTKGDLDNASKGQLEVRAIPECVASPLQYGLRSPEHWVFALRAFEGLGNSRERLRGKVDVVKPTRIA